MQRERAMTCVSRGTRTEVGTAAHPLDPLTLGEISVAAGAVRASPRFGRRTWCETITLAEPGKHEARTGTPRRLAYVCVFDPDRLRHGGGQLRTQHGRTIARRCVDHYALPIGPDNPHGKTMGRRETLLRTELAAQRDIDLPAARRWRISNPGRRNRIGVPVAYELVPGANALPFAHPDSPIGRRAGFMYHHLWVTQFAPDELHAAGWFPNQDAGGSCLPAWTARDRAIRCSRWSGSASSSSPSASSTATRR
jgi:Cu2+-containing amine oxidase